jgi:hypothetical protein
LKDLINGVILPSDEQINEASERIYVKKTDENYFQN